MMICRACSSLTAVVLVVATLFLLLPAAGLGQDADALLRAHAGRYALNSGAVDMRFTVKVLTGEEITGRFASVSGEFTIDRRAIENSRIDVVIEPASVETGSERVNGFLKSAGFFDVGRYPRAEFVSTALHQTGATTAELHGNLTLRGITRQIRLDIELSQPGARPRFHITGYFYRSKFGMDVGQPIYGDRVHLDIVATGKRI